MIREDNITLSTLTEDLRNDGVSIKEYVTRSEGAALFTVALNKILLDKYKSHPTVYRQIFKVINIGDGQGSQTRFPDMNGINPAYVPELSEIPFANLDITSTVVEPDKYAIRVGISQEMIDDNETNLLGWNMEMVGRKMAELEDAESLKALHTFYATGAVVDTSLSTFKGNYNRGEYHVTGACSNSYSATALDWETIIASGMYQLQAQTITILGETYKYPVYANTILVNSSKYLGLAKVINATTVVSLTGVGASPAAAAGLQLAGSNVFKGILNIVASPYQAGRTSWLFDSNRGSLVFLQRQTPKIEKNANWAFDAQEVRAITRFRAAVVEERGLLPILN